MVFEDTISANPGALRSRVETTKNRAYMADWNVCSTVRQEAARASTQALTDREHGVAALDARQTVRDYLTSWIRTEVYRVKRGSARRYEREVRLHLIPGLGRIVLSKLTTQHVSTFYAHDLEQGDTSTRVAYTHRALHAALEDAFRIDVVQRDVADPVDPPRTPKRQMAIYSEQQARMLLRAAAGDRLEALRILVLATGMRKGELLALTWSDVDLERARLTTKMTVQHYPGEKAIREEVKTSHSERVIALPTSVVSALRAHGERQAEEHARLGEAWNDLDLVFPNIIGRPIDARSFQRRWWMKLVQKAGLPYIRFHDLRHTAATLLLARGVPAKAVSVMLGHANASITLNLYGHVLPHMQQQLADVMDDILTEERQSNDS